MGFAGIETVFKVMREDGLVMGVRVRTQGDTNIKSSERKNQLESPGGQQGGRRDPRQCGGPGPAQRLFLRTARGWCRTLTRIEAE